MMEGYKVTELGNVPESWAVASIGSISTVVRGASPRPQGDPRYFGGNIPRLMGRDVSRDGKFVTPKVDFLTKEGAQKSRFMKAGTLVMICSGDVGVPSILAVDACVHDGFLAFPEISKECELEFLFYIFDSLYDRFNMSATHGGVFTNLTTTIVKDFKIPLPPLPEQQKIASILSIVDEKIQIIDAQIRQTQQLKKGLMQQLLTKGIGHTKFKSCELGEIPESWEVVKFGQLIESINYGPRFNAKDYNPNGNVKTIRGTDIGKNGDILYSQVPLALLENSVVELHKLKESDLVMITTADCGSTGVFINQSIPFIPSAYAVRIRLKEKKNVQFVKYLLRGETSIKQINSLIRKGTVANLPASDILKITIALPPSVEQAKIAIAFNLLDEKLQSLQSRKETYQQLKKGLMQQLLTGKMRVKLTDTEPTLA